MLTRTGRTIWKRKPRRSRRAMIQRLRSISRRSPLRLSHFRFVTSTTRSSSDRSESSFPSSFSSLPRSTSASGSYTGLTSASSTSSLELVDPLPSPMVLYRLSLRAGMHPIVTAASPRDTSFVASSVSASSRRLSSSASRRKISSSVVMDTPYPLRRTGTSGLSLTPSDELSSPLSDAESSAAGAGAGSGTPALARSSAAKRAGNAAAADAGNSTVASPPLARLKPASSTYL